MEVAGNKPLKEEFVTVVTSAEIQTMNLQFGATRSMPLDPRTTAAETVGGAGHSVRIATRR